MRPDDVVVPPPSVDQDLRFHQCVEDLPVEQLITQRAIEGFAVSVFPWRTWRDVERLHTGLPEPLPHRPGDEFGTIIRPYMRRRPAGDEQIGQGTQHILAPEPSRDRQGQAVPAGIVDDRQDPELAAIVGPSLDEVVGHTWPGYSGRSRIHDPSLSHRRERFGCLCGTLRHSRRQIRSTRLRFTCHPASCSKAVTRR